MAELRLGIVRIMREYLAVVGLGEIRLSAPAQHIGKPDARIRVVACAEKPAVLLDGRIVVAGPGEAIRHGQSKLVGLFAFGRIGELAQPQPCRRAIVLGFVALQRALRERDQWTEQQQGQQRAAHAALNAGTRRNSVITISRSGMGPAGAGRFSAASICPMPFSSSPERRKITPRST